MKIYVSRYGNPELKSQKYTALRISLGSPKWDVGYPIAGEVKALMPWGLLKKFEEYEDFKPHYFKLLDRFNELNVRAVIERFDEGKPIVLLCYEDIRKGKETWCHRTAFAEWWKQRTGEEIEELPDPSGFKPLDPTEKEAEKVEPQPEQISLFEHTGGSISLYMRT